MPFPSLPPLLSSSLPLFSIGDAYAVLAISNKTLGRTPKGSKECTSTASFAKFSRIKRYRGKILAVTDVLVQVCAENLKCKFLYRYMSCPQTFAKIPTDQRELCKRGCTRTYHAFCSDLWLGRYIFTSHNTATNTRWVLELSTGIVLVVYGIILGGMRPAGPRVRYSAHTV